jgi:hypothetical protein
MVNETRYKVYEKFMYEYGPGETYLNISANQSEWITEFNTTKETMVIGGKILKYDKGTIDD